MRGVWRRRSWVEHPQAALVVGIRRQAADQLGAEIGDHAGQHGEAEAGADGGEHA